MAVSALFQGLILGASMIIPLGAQNSYVLSQGIKRNHHFLTATICMLCDISLIGLGVFGGGQLIAANEWLMLIMGWGGVSFLLMYSGFAFRNVWRNQYQTPDKVKVLTSRKAVVTTTLAVTLLNPHVYLDTVMILGSIAGTFTGQEKIFFALGTMLASLLWFYSLAGGAAKLAPWLSQPKVQRCIDLFIGLIMCFVAYTLFNSILK
jgi:L-lysine exporter family protein LysE/ArgO